jgi:hypothetical protein
MSYTKKGYIQGERSFQETIEKCCESCDKERIEASEMMLDAANRFKHVYDRKHESDER